MANRLQLNKRTLRTLSVEETKAVAGGGNSNGCVSDAQCDSGNCVSNGCLNSDGCVSNGCYSYGCYSGDCTSGGCVSVRICTSGDCDSFGCASNTCESNGCASLGDVCNTVNCDTGENTIACNDYTAYCDYA